MRGYTADCVRQATKLAGRDDLDPEVRQFLRTLAETIKHLSNDIDRADAQARRRPFQ